MPCRSSPMGTADNTFEIHDGALAQIAPGNVILRIGTRRIDQDVAPVRAQRQHSVSDDLIDSSNACDKSLAVEKMQ